jgi:ABC-type spermidine/putrescine transport system permease subunit II
LKVIKIIVSVIFALIAAIWLVSFTLRAVATFEWAMLPKLILPIIIVAIVAYLLIYNTFFSEKQKWKQKRNSK